MNFPKFVRLPSSLPPTRFFPVSRRNFAVGPGGKPWFVDEDEEEPNGIMSTTPTGSTSLSPPTVPTIIPPPPPSAPSYLAHTYHYLASLPLIDPSTIHIGTPTPAETHPDPNLPLPMLKKVRKARGKKERGYGRGVGEGIGQGVYQWEVVAQVKEGSEARGSIEVVAASVRDMLRRDFPTAPRPSKSLHKHQKDGWELLDLGNAVVHICSRRAWQKWIDPQRNW